METHPLPGCFRKRGCKPLKTKGGGRQTEVKEAANNCRERSYGALEFWSRFWVASRARWLTRIIGVAQLGGQIGNWAPGTACDDHGLDYSFGYFTTTVRKGHRRPAVPIFLRRERRKTAMTVGKPGGTEKCGVRGKERKSSVHR